MTKAQIQAVIQQVEAANPGLRLSNRYAWTELVAHACYKIDQTVGQKRADLGRPVSDDTIAWAASAVPGTPGQAVAVPLNAVDLLDGGTGAIHFDENPGITNQFFVIPPYSGGSTSPVPTPPSAPPYPDEPTYWKTFQDRVKAAYNAVGRKFPDENDMDAFRRFSRCGYSIGAGERPAAEAANKHVRELRSELGAPPE